MNEKKRMSNKKRATAVVALIMVLALILGTFSWFSSKHDVRNIFKMDNFLVDIVENFDPEIPAEPGVEIKKDVAVTNFGNVDALVRVKVSEEFQYAVLTAGQAADPSQGIPEVTQEVDYTYIPDTTDLTRLPEAQIIATTTANALEKMIPRYDYKESIPPLPAGNVPTLTTEGKHRYEKVYRNNDGTNRTEHLAFEIADTGLLNGDGTKKLVYRNMKYTGGTVPVWEYAIYHLDADRMYTGTHAVPAAAHEALKNSNASLSDTMSLHNYVTVNEGTQVSYFAANGDINASGAKWVYFNGYFYYTELLKGGATTESLIVSVFFDEDNVDNTFKGARYIMHPKLEAIQATEGALVSYNWFDEMKVNGNDPVIGANTYSNAYNLLTDAVKIAGIRQ